MIQEWAPSCLSKSNWRKVDHEEGDLQPAGEWDPGLPTPRASRKPLRESDLAPAPQPQAAPVADVVPHVPVAAAVHGRKEREYVWAYKYRPRSLDEFICNKDRVEELKEMVRKQKCGHLIFEGPPGVGKRTMALAYLRDALGPENLKTKNELRKIELKGEHITTIDVNLRISSKHVEINLSELPGYEKHVLVSLINESHSPLDKPIQCDPPNFRAIVVHEADKLSTDAQFYIRWIMEKYKGCNKIFFCCSDASKLQTIKHLCKIVELRPPSDSEIVEVLELIAKQEHIELSQHQAQKIAQNSKNNLRQAVRSFEASWKYNSFKDEVEILTGWEDDIAKIATSIVKDQSPKQLYIIRGKLKKLIEHDVSPDFIFSTLVCELKKQVINQFHGKIDAMYQEYKLHVTGSNSSLENVGLYSQEVSGDKSHDQRKNVHYFMKIEEFTAKFMSYYKLSITKGIRGSGCR
ncbi:replication factor C subunit 3-like [Asparagus officinalis]|nr:replication factor C subunit 3-like [Asparagus officinalis]